MPLRFSLRQLEYLVAVGECGSIALASEKVNVSSPSISAAISQLEQEFGLPLFVRKHAHGLSLTQGGHRFVAQARLVLAEAARLNDLANDITGKVRGPLSVGCLVSFARFLLPALRRSFVDRNPEVAFRQFELDQSEIFKGLRSARIDVALSYDMNIPPDLEFVPLVSLPPYAILPDLPLSADYFLSFFTRTNLRLHIAERTRDMAVMRSLVTNGFGYSIANIRPSSDLSPDGRRLRHVPLTGPVRQLKLGLLLSEGARASLTIRAFVDHAQTGVTAETVPGLRLRPDGPVRDF